MMAGVSPARAVATGRTGDAARPLQPPRCPTDSDRGGHGGRRVLAVRKHHSVNIGSCMANVRQIRIGSKPGMISP